MRRATTPPSRGTSTASTWSWRRSGAHAKAAREALAQAAAVTARARLRVPGCRWRIARATSTDSARCPPRWRPPCARTRGSGARRSSPRWRAAGATTAPRGSGCARMLRYENALWTTGVARIAGVDEAGMSPLAGPVAAAAVIFAARARASRRSTIPSGSTSRQRNRLAPIIRQKAPRLGGRLRRGRRDRLHQHLLGRAGCDAPRHRGAGAGGGAPADRRPPAARRRRCRSSRIIKGDGKSLSIAAASILAKTARDARMRAARRPSIPDTASPSTRATR